LFNALIQHSTALVRSNIPGHNRW